MEYREITVYALVAVVIVVAVLVAMSGSILGGSYNVDVALRAAGQAAVYPYQTSHFVINVTNNGSSTVSGMLLGFYINGLAISTNTVQYLRTRA